MNFNWSEATQSVQVMANGFIERLPYFAIAILVFIVFVLLGHVVRRGIRALSERGHKHRNIGLVLGRLGYGVSVFIGLLVALVIAVPGFTPGQLVNLLGLSSVAIGFAFRDILQNFLAGILILLAQPFRIGDQIVLKSFEGTVENIETRATFIRTYDGRRIVIPNSELFTNPVTVNTAYEKRRLQYDIGIGYGDDIVRAKQVMLASLQDIPDVLREPAPDAIVVDLAASTVNIRLRWWVHPPRQLDVLNVQDTVLERVKTALMAAGIDLPFPTTQILFHDQTEETDGDRGSQREGWPKGQGAAPGQAGIGRIISGMAVRRKRGGDNES
ncbi:mechanosensitive ion channel family protein [Noviherbaspirillum agri]